LDNLDNYKQYLLTSREEVGTDPDNQLTHGIQTVIGGDHPILPLGKGYAMVTTQVYMANGEKNVVGLITPIHLLAKKKNLELIEAISKALNSDNLDK
jgi:hypothetical protein